MCIRDRSEGAEGLTDGHATARGQTNEQAEASQYAENGELQLYLDYLGGPTFRYNSCAGSQCLPMLTEDNVPVESDWEAVSYTHLDVYKRQAVPSLRSRGPAPRYAHPATEASAFVMSPSGG